MTLWLNRVLRVTFYGCHIRHNVMLHSLEAALQPAVIIITHIRSLDLLLGNWLGSLLDGSEGGGGSWQILVAQLHSIYIYSIYLGDRPRLNKL